MGETIIVCGVSGVGKTTVGKLLAAALQIPFHDADDFHPASNVEKMAAGLPLNDEDRQPWLETLAENLATWQKEGGAVLACSALKESYREALASRCNGSPRWIVLHAAEAVLAQRLDERKGHVFDPQLLASQLEAFKPPDYGWLLDATAPPQKIVADILRRLGNQVR